MLKKAAADEKDATGEQPGPPHQQDPGTAIVVRRPPSEPPVGPLSSAPPPSESGPSWNRADWQKLWLSTQRTPWRSLALVPAGEVPDSFTLDIAVSLVRTGATHLGVLIRIADARHVPLAHLMQFKNEVDSVSRSGDLVLIALGPIQSNPTTVSLAQAADLTMLCVPLGQASASDAKKTINEIGQKRFLGSASFRVR